MIKDYFNWVIRPLEVKDIDDLFQLACSVAPGMTSLPPDYSLLEKKLALVADSFQGKQDDCCCYFWGCIDLSQQLVGCCGLYQNVRSKQPQPLWQKKYFSGQDQALFIQLNTVQDHVTELCGLALMSHLRRQRLGRLLSCYRFLQLAAFPDFFSDKIWAELRGYLHHEQHSPFFDAIIYPIIKRSFEDLDASLSTDHLDWQHQLPKSPIRLDTLPLSVRQAIGAVHRHSLPAATMLCHQGFRYSGHYNCLDAGPLLQAYRHQLKWVQLAQCSAVERIVDLDWDQATMALVTGKRFGDPGGLIKINQPTDGMLWVDRLDAARLNIQLGDSIWWLPWSSE